ncbi:MAG: hypothetical protein HXS47_09910 [Theionarchaea archaeon]|nr:hypothetical protein [Theionarchaea archaeon]
MPRNTSRVISVTIPIIVYNIIEEKLGCLGNSTSERMRNITMIYLAERGYLRDICQGFE